MQGRSELRDLRILLVEDEALIAMLIEDGLQDLNCKVFPASTLGEALDKAATTDFDIAILDVNLNGRPAYPIAELLVRRHIPFVFLTGYGASGVPDTFRGAPVLAKPFTNADLARVLEGAMTVHGRATQ